MSMLRSFFEIGCDGKLFDGLEIAGEKELCEKYMGKYPVIPISLKGVEAENWEEARDMIAEVIREEARRFQFLFDSDRLTEIDKEFFSLLLKARMSDKSLKSSLRELSLLLCRHYGQQVIILIDEYDVPLAKANERGYYDRMALLIRNIFTEQILAMFKEKTAKDGTLLNAFCSALAEGRPKEMERLFTSYMEKR